MGSALSCGLRARVSLEKHGFSFTHSLGQNFILDDDFLETIVSLSGVCPEDCVMEIGPGAGVLTHHLALHAQKVLAIEIDRKLEPVLTEVLENVPNVHLIFADVLRCDLPELLRTNLTNGPVKVVANLPYYITADIIERLLTCGADISEITMMVQREAAEHISAPVGEKNYGALSALVQYHCQIETKMEVPPEHFFPQPHVMSRLITLKRKTDGERAFDESLLWRVIRSAFRMRRKTLVNNLIGDFAFDRQQAEAILSSMNLDGRVRGEVLDANQFAHLTNLIQNALKYRQ